MMKSTICAFIGLVAANIASAEVIRLEPNQSVVVAGEPAAIVHYRGYGYSGLSNCHLMVAYEGFEPFSATTRDDDLRQVYTYPQPFQLDSGAVVICRSHGDYVEIHTDADAVAALSALEASVPQLPAWAEGKIDCGSAANPQSVWNDAIEKLVLRPENRDDTFAAEQQKAAMDNWNEVNHFSFDSDFRSADVAHRTMCQALAHMSAGGLTPSDLGNMTAEDFLLPFQRTVQNVAAYWLKAEETRDGWKESADSGFFFQRAEEAASFGGYTLVEIRLDME